MLQDAQGLRITAASQEAARAYDHALNGLLGNRADLLDRVSALAALDPDCAMGVCLKSLLAMLSFKQANTGIALQVAGEASRLARAATQREQAHAAALEAWADGEPSRAAAIWDEILLETPRDVLAFRLAHFVRFWQGRPDLMLRSVLQVEQAWDPSVAGWSMILACRCFALEECGHYLEAEAAGREAIALDPADLWAAHGVAHVMEMQGRRSEGLAWIDGLRRNWDGANNLRHHLWWHAAVFHLERGEVQDVLRLYDEEFRNPASPLTQANPDLYIDVQNATSMLFRLGLRGIDVGSRWEELADHAEKRIGDCASAFTLPHWMMALATAGRHHAAERLLEAMRATGMGNGEAAAIVRECALPVSEAVFAHARGQYQRAAAAMRPALGGMYRMGGSHAQQDVLEQLFLDAAVKAGLNADVEMLLERVAGRYKVPLARRAAYAAAARAHGFA